MQKEAGTDCSAEEIRVRAAAGRLAPGGFLAAAGAVYLLGLAGQLLTAPVALARFGLWPFLLMQVALTAAWYVLHARRLRDAGRSIAPAQGIAVIHVLAVVLLVLVGAFFMENGPDAGWTPQSLLLLEQLISFSQGGLLSVLGLVACAALLIAPAFSVWAASLPGRPA